MLSCLDYNSGVVGCGSLAYTAHVFSISARGDTVYTYVFTGDNPERCVGVYSTPS